MDSSFINLELGRLITKNWKSMKSMIKREFIYGIIFNNLYSRYDIDSYRQLLGAVHLPNVALVVHIDAKEESDRDWYRKKRKAALKKLEDHLDSVSDGLVAILGRDSIHAAVAGDREIAVLLPVHQEDDPRKQAAVARRYSEYIKVVMERNSNYTVSIGIGNGYKDVRDLSASFREAGCALKYKFYTGNSSIIHYQDINIEADTNHRLFTDCEESIIKCLRRNSFDEAAGVIRKMFGMVNAEKRISPDIIKIRVLEMVTIATRTAINMGVSPETMLSLRVRAEDEVQHCTTLGEARDWLEGVIKAIVESIEMIQQDNIVRIVNSAKAYMEDNFARNISLEDTADHVDLSPYYLSRIFKEVTGQNFSTYLTRLRIMKAQSILMSSGIPVAQVGYMVGYQDPNYFSRTFKRVVGKSPNRFRQGK